MSLKEKTEAIKMKAKEVKGKIVDGTKKVGKAVVKVAETNPGAVVTLAFSVGGAIIGMITGAANAESRKYEMCKVEDEVTGLDYLTSHPLTNSEILELSDRMVDGQTTGEALENMGVLRNEKKRR